MSTRPVESFRITEHGRRLLERDAMLGPIDRRFAGVPFEHGSVYTKLGRRPLIVGQRTNSTRSVCVRRSAPAAFTTTVSLNASPCADTYMWKTIPGSSAHVAVGTNSRVKSLVRGDHGA